MAPKTSLLQTKRLLFRMSQVPHRQALSTRFRILRKRLHGAIRNPSIPGLSLEDAARSDNAISGLTGAGRHLVTDVRQGMQVDGRIAHYRSSTGGQGKSKVELVHEAQQGCCEAVSNRGEDFQVASRQLENLPVTCVTPGTSSAVQIALLKRQPAPPLR